MSAGPELLAGPGTGVAAGGPSFSLVNRLFRLVWIVAWALLAAWTPPPLAKWRRAVLVAFGARVHPSARIHGSARIWYPPMLEMQAGSVLGPRTTCYCMARIFLGEGAVVSQGAHLCAGTHEIDDPGFPLVAKPITIGRAAWVAAEAFVGPGVTIGDHAVLTLWAGRSLKVTARAPSTASSAR